MSKIYKWYNGLSKRVHDSIAISVTGVGMLSTILSISGISLGDIQGLNLCMRIVAVALAVIVVYVLVYLAIGKIFKDSINITIQQTDVSVSYGDIFEAPELRVIGCDTHFDTRIDDIVISKKSLHGQLFLDHGNKDEISMAIDIEAKRLGLQKTSEGLYDFPLGTIVRYDSSVDNHTYLMLAMTELNAEHEAHTNMAKFEFMLMKMWREISRVYALNDVVLPILGAGIPRFDDCPKDKGDLLRCMLCTLNSSGVTLKSKVKVLIYGDIRDISLYEYRNMFHASLRR